ncbi:predicted protein [Plenodomus lingam JN3]|uniref:Predicted protein n=1 Tax=Leptosphaeria maculans (strain JN3 / isolate v23.1.3 / race Av1-4-5-6-7-8) TaxID=985895 RepID=E4ZV97_LEPMJ|nr:predicted protein [Plenodomus lingam JN3]CBX95523.1 predicted protein [Plenodomus lingam JN3]
MPSAGEPGGAASLPSNRSRTSPILLPERPTNRQQTLFLVQQTNKG